MLFYLSQYLLERAAGTEWVESLYFLGGFGCITVRGAGAAGGLGEGYDEHHDVGVRQQRRKP